MEEARQDVVLTIIISSIILVILAVSTMLFFLIFIRKKRIINEKKDELSRNFEKQLLQTKLEIQSETLNNISREIHDNIGQVLSFIKLNLSTCLVLDTQEKDEKIKESTRLISEVINDLRDLSKSFSFEKIKKEGLSNIIIEDVERLQKSKIINASLIIEGNPVRMTSQFHLVLYRIFQEVVNNTLKHSKSKKIVVTMKFEEKCFILSVRDSGIGFSEKQEKVRGLGLENIRQRAALIGADLKIITAPEGGCLTEVTLNNDLIF